MLCFSSTFLLACEFKTIRFADAILYLKIICSIHYHYPIKIYQGKSALNINTKMGKVLDKKGFLEHKCKSCGKSFSVAQNLKRHIHTFHEGHKDYKFESCGKSFTSAQILKKHIHTIHEGHTIHTSIHFIKATKIINVNLVANHFLKQKI